MLKNLVLVLALWFLIEWAYKEKIKPFLKAELTTEVPAAPKKTPVKDSTVVSKPLSLVKNLLTKDSVTYGLDISHYQGDLISTLNKRKDSLYFVICKATEGTSYIDPTYQNNCTLLKEKHVIRGAYHFYLCEYDPIDQAQHFAKVIMENQFLNIGHLPPVMDIENSSMDTDCGNLQTAQKNILLFLEEVEKITGRIPMIYTNKSTGDKYLNTNDFAKYHLWIAAYTQDLTVSNIPSAWDKDWTIWQRSDSYSFQETDFDFDIFNGNRLELRKFIRNTIVKKKTSN
ncbi:glycoside hydrolase family 25 protein [Flavobacterium sp. J27]|uniref:glycoside hydrolase family 25 protein n=1 Tax=Flavobacterium sp. J27 TaxID=2060419 RepID=UPI0010323ECE|nr:GH25 family lysozyme [Flavobacterium sp. J27]